MLGHDRAHSLRAEEVLHEGRKRTAQPHYDRARIRRFDRFDFSIADASRNVVARIDDLAVYLQAENAARS